MRRQFEKVLNDFQPGLLESLMSQVDESEDEVSYLVFAARELNNVIKGRKTQSP